MEGIKLKVQCIYYNESSARNFHYITVVWHAGVSLGITVVGHEKFAHKEVGSL